MIKKNLALVLGICCVSSGFAVSDLDRERVSQLLGEIGKALAEGDSEEEIAEELESAPDSNLEPKKQVRSDLVKDNRKEKAHFVGSKRSLNPPQEVVDAPPKKPSRLRNEWVTSKTYPKQKKTPVEEAAVEEELAPVQAPFRPFSLTLVDTSSSDCAEVAKSLTQTQKKLEQLRVQVNVLEHRKDQGVELAQVPAARGRFFLFGEWLFWRPCCEGTDFALSSPSSSFFQTSEKRVRLDWSSGFRVGAGWHLPKDHWALTLCYTDFSSRGSRHEQGILFPSLAYQPAFLLGSVTDAHARSSLSLQQADVLLGRSCPVTKTLLMYPFIGIKGASMTQRLHCSYRGDPSGKYSLHSTQKNQSVGGMFGVDTDWQMGGGFSLFGNLYGAFLVGHWNLSQQHRAVAFTEGNPSWKSSFNQLNPMADFLLGLRWDRTFHQERYHTGLSLGFETQYWWNQNQMVRFTDDLLPLYRHVAGDLSFYGLTLSARLDF